MEQNTEDLYETVSSAFYAAEAEDEHGTDDPSQEDDSDDKAVSGESDETGAKEEKAEPHAEHTVRAPSSWKPAAQEAFLKASRNEQLTTEEVALLTAEAQRREGDYHKGIEQYKSHANTAQAFNQAIDPYLATINSLGIDAPAAVGRLLQMDHNLRYSDEATKTKLLSQLAQEYGVDLAQAAGMPQVDPATRSLQQQLQQLQMQNQQLTSQQAAREQTQYHSEIEKFAANPENKYFETVRDDMALLLQSGKASDLKEAYDTAVWMRADTRKSLVEEQRTEASRLAVEQSRNARAKTASASVRGGTPSSAGSQAPKGSLRDQILATINDAS